MTDLIWGALGVFAFIYGINRADGARNWPTALTWCAAGVLCLVHASVRLEGLF